MSIRWIAAALILAAGACSGGSSGAGPVAEPVAEPVATSTPAAPAPAAQGGGSSNLCVESITIKDGKPSPARLVVQAPCAVMFTNRDDTVAQIQGQDATPFTLGEMGKDQSWAHTYKDPGQWEWVNTKDPAVRGTVVVRQ